MNKLISIKLMIIELLCKLKKKIDAIAGMASIHIIRI